MTSPPAPTLDPQIASRHSRLVAIAWVCWIVYAIALASFVARDVRNRSVVPAYRGAALAWLHSEPCYKLDSIHGFLYLPSSAVLTTPFALLPATAHELAWRVFSILVLALAVRRLAKILSPITGEETFLPMTLMVLPVSVGSAMAGQMNLVLAASLAMAAADLYDRRWNRCALWLALGFALKPQMAVMVLLVGALYRPMRWRAGLALVAALALPWVTQVPTYAWNQYQLCWQKLNLAGNPEDAHARFNDLFGLVQSLGITAPENIQWPIRAVAALFTLLAGYIAVRRKDALHSAVSLLALTGAYLMLFNPRTEGGSYVIVAVPLAVYGIWAGQRDRSVARSLLLILMVIGWTLAYDIAHGLFQAWRFLINPNSTFNFRYWLSPALGVVFAVYTGWAILRKRGTFLDPARHA